jgi:hypothetical protein
MRRSLLRRARRQSGWRRTATVAADRLVVPEPVQTTAHLAPAETASDGLAVETHILARLLGVKLLTLEGVVLVSPAAVSREDSTTASTSTTRTVSNPPGQISSRRYAHTNGLTPGSGLAGAARLLDECAAELRALDADRIARP